VEAAIALGALPPFFKTRVCTGWAGGQGCAKGDRCYYAHGLHEVRGGPGAAAAAEAALEAHLAATAGPLAAAATVAAVAAAAAAESAAAAAAAAAAMMPPPSPTGAAMDAVALWRAGRLAGASPAPPASPARAEGDWRSLGDIGNSFSSGSLSGLSASASCSALSTLSESTALAVPSAEARAIADGLGLPDLDDLCTADLDEAPRLGSGEHCRNSGDSHHGSGDSHRGSGDSSSSDGGLHADATPFRPACAPMPRVPSWNECTLAVRDGEIQMREGRPLFRRGSGAATALASAAAAAAAEAEAEAQMHALSCR
jgi:hypothetical protein